MSSNPPTEFDGSKVTSVKDYSKGGHKDEEGDDIPKEKMLWVFLADGRAFAVRPSGTEPKIKYYLYGKAQPAGGKFSDDELGTAKAEGGRQPQHALARHRAGHRREAGSLTVHFSNYREAMSASSSATAVMTTESSAPRAAARR